jgi:hypothetical protein
MNYLHTHTKIAALLGARFRSSDACLNNEDGLEGNGPLDVPAGCNMGRRRSRAVLYQLSGHYVSYLNTHKKIARVVMNLFIAIYIILFFFIHFHAFAYSHNQHHRNRRKSRLN